jgi:hypothetical protein
MATKDSLPPLWQMIASLPSLSTSATPLLATQSNRCRQVQLLSSHPNLSDETLIALTVFDIEQESRQIGLLSAFEDTSPSQFDARFGDCGFRESK